MDGSQVGCSIARAARTLRSVDSALPSDAERAAMAELSAAIEKRGHFLPSEEEAVLGGFGRYLSIRAALHETIADLQSEILAFDSKPPAERLRIFATGLVASSMLWRWAGRLVNELAHGPVVRAKLDQGEPRFGIPRNQFTEVYRSVHRPRNALRYLAAARFAEHRWDQLLKLPARTQGDGFEVVREMLATERARMVPPDHATYLRRTARFLGHALRRRGRSSLKSVTFALFETSGRIVSEARNPLYSKKLTLDRQRELLKLVQPGDVFVTRHHDALTNLFLPGYWPHGFLFIGSDAERAALGIKFPEHRMPRSADPVRFLEARKDGVLFRPPADSLAVDAVAVIRPRLSPQSIRQGIERGATHEGKGYDFEFDFARSDRIVCTEVVYRSYQGLEGLHFPLEERAGRVCLPAAALLRMSLQKDGPFTPVATCGAEGSMALSKGTDAAEVIRRTTSGADC